ncbi:MAG: OmpA family protein [Polyangiaceae bacterium]|nr:OmpA family protein [Polyangiaceae bacterium]
MDREDQCPSVAEDHDGYIDEDGCPELDNDGDGVADWQDACPLEVEDTDGFQDEDGCPDPDNDGDGVLDDVDQCPLLGEDLDGFEDTDGCPDEDNDGDGFADKNDLCPFEKETVNGIADQDGCPDVQSVKVVGDRIELEQKIHFWSNSFTIRAMSYPVLNRLAQLLKEHPEYIRVDIAGHSDQRGDAELNQKISQLRATAIEDFLVKKGVERHRLSSAGFGSELPTVRGNNERAWFMNRRVEFVVLRDADHPRAERKFSSGEGQ